MARFPLKVDKKGLAERHPHSVDRYCRAKTDFIADRLRRSGMAEHEVAAVQPLRARC